MDHSGLWFCADPPEGALAVSTDRRVYLGDDAFGVELEVIAVMVDGAELLVIHAMELRPRFRVNYEEAKPFRI